MQPLFIAGPCVIESQELLNTVAEEIVRINAKLGTNYRVGFSTINTASLGNVIPTTPPLEAE